MTDFLRRLAVPRNVIVDKRFTDHTRSDEPSALLLVEQLPKPRTVFPYGRRNHWVPKSQMDFADGGAFPECNVLQYPLEMGKALGSQKGRIVALERDATGKLSFDSVLQINKPEGRVLHTNVDNQLTLTEGQRQLALNTPEDTQENLERTRQALADALDEKLSAGTLKSKEKRKTQFFKYTPSQQAAGHNSNCAQRIIKMVDAALDPLEPPRFKHKKVPAGPPSPPAAIQHSPPRKLTQADQLAWKIPPCVSNWKNQKGYTIPLDKRLQADGRGLLEVSVNDRFAALSESLYIAERAAREEIRIRNELLKKKKAQAEVMREEDLRHLAAKTRLERGALLDRQSCSEDMTVAANRNRIEREREIEIERQVRMERTGKHKRNREEARDISERQALGQPIPTTQESTFDSRLFDRTGGLSSGLGTDETAYNIYDKPLFADRSTTGIYRFEKDRVEQSLGTSLPVPSFAGAEQNRDRIAPVEFEKAADPFGLDSLLSAAKNANRGGS